MKTLFKSIKAKWLLYYLLILMIPLIGAAVSFFYTNRIITEELIESKAAILNHTKENMEHTIDQLDLVWRNMMLDTSLQELLSENTNDKNFVSKVLPAQKALFNYQSNIIGVDILIYIKEFDYILSPTTSNYSTYIHNALKFTGKLDLSLDEWRGLLSREMGPLDYSASAYYSYGNQGNHSLTKAYSISRSIMKNNIHANIFVSIPLSYMDKQFNTGGSETFVLLNREGYVLHAFQDSVDAISLPDFFDITSINAGNSVLYLDEVPYIFNYTDSITGGLRLAALTPQKDFWNKANYITYVTLYCLMSAVVVGLIFVAIFLRNNYKPIRRIMDLAKVNIDSNEYDAIFSSFENLHNENMDYRKKIGSQQEQIQNGYLLAKLYGRFSYLSDDDMRQYLNISVDHCKFGIVALHKKEKDWAGFYEQANRRMQKIDRSFSDDLAFFIIHNIFSELLDKKHFYYKLEDGDLLVYIFTITPENSKTWDEEITGILNKVITFFETNMSLPIGILVSEICTDFSSIHNAYQKVLACYEYQYVSESYGFLKTIELSDTHAHDSELMALNNIYEQFHTMVSLQYLQESMKLVDDLFNILNTEMKKPYVLTRLIAIQIACRLSSSICLENEERYGLDDVSGLLMPLFLSSDSVSLKHSFSDIIVFLCDTQTPEAETNNATVISSIENYVKENYTDINLSLSMIADAVNLSPKYVSMIFKTATSTGLLDYVNFIRIQKAKEILSNTRITVDEVSIQAGYSNAKTFRRAFLKFEGTTPGKYKSKPLI